MLEINKKNSLFLIFSWKLKKAYKDIFDELSRKLELTQNEIDVLLFLYNNSPLDTARDIARYRAMSKSMISKSVDSLYKRGFLSYRVNNRDKRCIHLIIEPKANSAIEKLSEAQREFFINLTKNITAEEYEIMENVVNKMHENIIE